MKGGLVMPSRGNGWPGRDGKGGSRKGGGKGDNSVYMYQDEERPSTIETYLKPILLDAIGVVLRNRVNTLLLSSPRALQDENFLRFYLFAQIEGFHSVVASSVDPIIPPQGIVTKQDQDIIEFSVGRKEPILVHVDVKPSIVFNPTDEGGQQRGLADSAPDKSVSDVKWIYAMPIFEKQPCDQSSGQ